MAVAVAPLKATELGDALVLARLGQARFDEAAWRGDLQALLAEDAAGGALLARNAAGRACGLMLYRILSGPDHRPSLEVLRLVAFDLSNPRSIADVLVAEAVRLARVRGCGTLRLIRPLDTSAEALDLVLASGLADLHSVF